MVRIKPFRAIRPKAEFAKDVAALPYDVMNTKEARQAVKENDKSFFRVDRAEVNFSEEMNVGAYDEVVYKTAKEVLCSMIEKGVLQQDDKEMLYIYEEIFRGNKQRGIVFCASIDDYIKGNIKKHELTRANKETDRIKHVDTCDANTGPIFLTYKNDNSINDIIDVYCENNIPVYDFESDDEVRHIVWTIDNDDIVSEIVDKFKMIKSLYIADGHHRTESAVRVGQMRRKENKGYTGKEEFNYFLAVAFPSEQLTLMDYNRVITVDDHFNLYRFTADLKQKFKVDMRGSGQYKPSKPRTFGMCVKGTWYSLEAKPILYKGKDVIDSLDVSVLENEILKPLLKIDDVRTNDRIDFVGGIRGLDELERRVQDDMDIAFAMYPPSIDDLIKVADAGRVMPPKSTWFEPKLRSGLFIHKLK